MTALSILRLSSIILLPLIVFSAPAQIPMESEDQGQLLPEVTVSALGFDEQVDRIAVPYNIIDSDSLLRRGDGTLGSALEGQVGVHVDSFGAGASRPVIRGQGAPRTRMLSDGAAVLDASDISPDHAVTVDPLLARRIEVLRGPAALLYGGGAVGGVVNVLDDKIPPALPEDGFAGTLVSRLSSVSNQVAGAAQMTAALTDQLAVHVEGSSRDAGNYRVPGWTSRRVPDSDARSTNSAFGLSWITPRGYVGAALSLRDDSYGLPGHTHDYEHCHAHGSSLHCDSHDDDDHDHDHGHADGDDEGARVSLRSQRFDVRGEYENVVAGVQRLRFRAAHTDYRHHELDHGQIATTFRNRGHDARVEIEHVPWGPLSGVVGAQHAQVRAAVEGVEAFMPTVRTQSHALFAVQHIELGDVWHLELGARHEYQKHIPDEAVPAHSGSAASYSGALIWNPAPGWSWSMSAARSQRLPHAQELYARGIHLATNTHECGLMPAAITCGGAANDRPIRKETANNIELGLRKEAGRVSLAASIFVNSIDDFVWARTLDQHEDFRLIKYSQDDARFHGGELELGYVVNDFLSLELFADRVRARLRQGDDLPRIPAGRSGLRLQGGWGGWDGELELYRVHAQRRLASFEAATSGYDMLNARLAYQLPMWGDANVFVAMDNLLNRQAWNHASFLAHTIPLPGRNVNIGLRVEF